MIIIGDKRFGSETLFYVQNIEDIAKTPSNCVVLLNKQDIDLQYFCFKNKVEYAIVIQDFKEAIYANNLHAKYIISNKDIAEKLQKIAENYLFDAKILAIINNEDEINKLCEIGIDGIIYENILNLERADKA